MPPNIHICRERKISFELLYFGMTGAPLGLESSLRKERRTFPKCYFIEKETLILSFSPSCLHRIMKLWINKYFLVPTISFITQRTHFIKEIQARIFQIASNKDPMRWNLWIPEALQAEARASESKNLFHCTFSWRCKILPTLRSWEFHSSMRQKGVSSPWTEQRILRKLRKSEAVEFLYPPLVTMWPLESLVYLILNESHYGDFRRSGTSF